MADRENNFSCQHCHRICDWETRQPVRPHPEISYKTIGSRYCDAAECVEAEARACGLPVERVLANHRRGA